MYFVLCSRDVLCPASISVWLKNCTNVRIIIIIIIIIIILFYFKTLYVYFNAEARFTWVRVLII
jgi:hypothetical protein